MNSGNNRIAKLLTRFWAYLHMRFDLNEDGAAQDDVIENISKGVEFRGTNLWVLIFATFIASLGLNVNSTAVIIGAMLVSPLMGPIMGIGLSLGINDFNLMKQSLRNFLLMVIVSILTSTLYFIVSPITYAQSELLARTTPTTYDVLIAFFGGLAGIVAQTRKERASTVISGVAIATALMPPLCTAGFGIATGNVGYFLGAAYLFFINSIFIALATYLMVVFMKFEKKVVLDEKASKRLPRYVWTIAIITIVPSAFLSVRIINRTTFESNADKYVNTVFQFEKTMVVNCNKLYRPHREASVIELRLVGEPLSANVIDNARAQMSRYGLKKTKLVIKQADTDKFDFSEIQKSYAEIIDEKNQLIRDLERKLASVQVIDTIATADISRELGVVADNIGRASVARHVRYDTNGNISDTVIVCTIDPLVDTVSVDVRRLSQWLVRRTKCEKVEIYTDTNKE